MQNRITSISLLLVLLAAVIYSMYSLQPSEHEAPLSGEHATTSWVTNTAKQTQIDDLFDESLALQMQPKSRLYTKTDSNIGLPIKVTLRGVMLSAGKSTCLLESDGQIGEFQIGDLIYNNPIQVLNILDESIVLGFENQTFNIGLLGPNLLQQQTEKTHTQLLEMSAEDIGNRPQLIEHFVRLTPTPYIADGMLASPGVNQTLFAQAGLKEDDVITTINGKNITIADEFSELQRTIRYADTLTITVMRRGRLVTLYLDIPSEALTIVR